MRYYHGIDPLELTEEQRREYLERIADIAEMESGEIDHRARAERMARRAEAG
jgi:hypothetical protein